MNTILNSESLNQDGCKKMIAKGIVESDEDDDIEALRAAALASMSKARKETRHDDYFYESYEEDVIMETDDEVEVTDSEPETSKKVPIADDFDDDCIAFHCDEVIDEEKPKKKKIVKRKVLVKRLVRKHRKIFLPKPEKLRRSPSLSSNLKIPSSPSYRSRSRSPRLKYRHSPYRDRSTSPYRSYKRGYSPYEYDQYSPRRDLRSSEEKYRYNYRPSYFDDRKSRSPRARERSPSRTTNPKYLPYSQTSTRERNGKYEGAYQPSLEANPKKVNLTVEASGSSSRRQQSGAKNFESSTRKTSSPITVSTTIRSPLHLNTQLSPNRIISHPVSSTTSPKISETTQPLEEKSNEKAPIALAMNTTPEESQLTVSKVEVSKTEPLNKQKKTSEGSETAIKFGLANAPSSTNPKDSLVVVARPESPSLSSKEAPLDVQNQGDLREQIEQLRRLRNKSPPTQVSEKVDLSIESKFCKDDEKPFKATNRIVKLPAKVLAEKPPFELPVEKQTESTIDPKALIDLSSGKKKSEKVKSRKRKRPSSSDSSDSSVPSNKKALKKKRKKNAKKKSKKVKRPKKTKTKKRKVRYSSSSSSSYSSSSDSEQRSRHRGRSSRLKRDSSPESRSSSSSGRSVERLKVTKEKSTSTKTKESKAKPQVKYESPKKVKVSKPNGKTDGPVTTPTVATEKKKSRPETKSNKKRKEKRKSLEKVKKVDKVKSKDIVKLTIESTKKRSK